MHETEKSVSCASKPEAGKLPLDLYELIVDSIPIPSVEAVISKDNSFLFLRRKNNPVKGQWWFPGGRIRKGETLSETLYREVKEETGLDLIESKLINVYSRIFDERHDITIAYLCKCKGDKIVLNDEHSEYKYFKNLPNSFHPYLTQIMNDLKNSFNPSRNSLSPQF
ncbi:MAG: NUDIX hydrolase [Candidatus Bathyarchaeota archaeon]|nr:NUDIX hydrolase [Candidatus Bathyarchaeum sp.]